MAIFKCKMCGGDLEVTEGKSICTCEYCGSKQTLPKLDTDKKSNLYDRANHFRRNNDFDKAIGIYEQILNEDNTDAEAYWSLVLCRYGIEYVEDTLSNRRIPTVNRAQYTSIYADEDYKSAINYASDEQKIIYEQEAKAIDEIQKGILAISEKEEPFDVFICYKETDENGRRTQDSVLANDLYHQLTQEGFKVFFSRITLEDKLGQEYEPYIFAALNSAKVMVVLGTKQEYFNAVWVKNEWSRFLALIRSGAQKTLVPAYKDMDPYDLPEDFSHLQAQDMSKLGFMQDLIRGIKKVIGSEKATEKETIVVQQGTTTGNVEALLKRGYIALEDGAWDEADKFFEEALNYNPEDAVCYKGKLFAKYKVKDLKSFVDVFADKYKNVIPLKTMACEENYEHIDKIVKKYGNVVNRQSILPLYYFNKEVKVFTEERKKQKNIALEALGDERFFTRAHQYATGDLKSEFDNAYSYFVELLDNRINKALKDDADIISKTKERYNSFLNETDCKVEELFRKQKKKEKGIILLAIFVLICISIAVCFYYIVLPKIEYSDNCRKYKTACNMIDNGEYDSAIRKFRELNGFKESEDMINKADYLKACELLENKEYDKAIEIFTNLQQNEKYEDAKEKKKEALYQKAGDLLDKSQYSDAKSIYIKLGNYKETKDKLFECNVGEIKNVNVGEYVDFGNYNKSTRWYVLKKDETGILVISVQAIDNGEFDEEGNNVWKDSTIREWLNGEYLNEAFSDKERKMIRKTTVSNSFTNENGNVIELEDTEDYIFLLSEQEFRDCFTFGGRICAPSNYLKEKSPTINDDTTAVQWWLRSQGGDSTLASAVDESGHIDDMGISVKFKIGVRPVMWINYD